MLDTLKELIDGSQLDSDYKVLIKRCMETAYMAGQTSVLEQLHKIEQEVYSETNDLIKNREPNPFEEAAKQTNEELWSYLLEGVTEGLPYTALKARFLTKD